jgi:hypothetical protein
MAELGFFVAPARNGRSLSVVGTGEIEPRMSKVLLLLLIRGWFD